MDRLRHREVVIDRREDQVVNREPLQKAAKRDANIFELLLQFVVLLAHLGQANNAAACVKDLVGGFRSAFLDAVVVQDAVEEEQVS